jgi:hypothetical protein
MVKDLVDALWQVIGKKTIARMGYLLGGNAG